MVHAARVSRLVRCVVPRLVLIIALLCGVAVRADPNEGVAEKIFSSVMSPFCPGRLLRDCPSSQATELKEKIRADLQSGASEEQVVSSLVGLYGREIQAAPAFSGVADFESLAWLAPAIFAGGGLLFLLIWLSARTGREETTPPGEA